MSWSADTSNFIPFRALTSLGKRSIIVLLSGTSVPNMQSEGHHKMRTKDSELVQRIKSYIEDQCEQRGRIPPIREIAEALGVGKSSVQRYMEYMTEQGIIARGEYGYESIEQSRTEKTVSVAKLGYVPCGPLAEEYECIDGYVRLPASFVGNAKKCFLLTASGNSMIDVGINDGDLVLVRQQETADYNDIVVALVENEVTLKRYRPDNEKGIIVLHPENKRMKDIVVNSCRIQGVAIKVIKDLEN